MNKRNAVTIDQAERLVAEYEDTSTFVDNSFMTHYQYVVIKLLLCIAWKLLSGEEK